MVDNLLSNTKNSHLIITDRFLVQNINPDFTSRVPIPSICHTACIYFTDSLYIYIFKTEILKNETFYPIFTSYVFAKLIPK